MIIYRYLTKEVLYSYLAIISILLFVALSNHFAILLTQAASGKLSVYFVFKIVVLYIPELFAHTTPLALFVAFLLSLSRLYADSEMIILYACGIKWRDIFKLAMIIAFFFSIMVTIFTLWIVPKSVVIRENVFSEAESFSAIQTITPGRFQIMDEGRIVFYVEDKNIAGGLRNAFIAQQPQNLEDIGNWTVITANKARFRDVSKDGKFYLVLDKGQRYSGSPGNKDYTVINFSEYGREIVIDEKDIPDYDRMKPTSKLLFSKNLNDISELQWRLAMPLSLIVLVMLAISLAKVDPRQGRFAKLLPAILIYIVYYNLITVSKRWILVEKLPSYLGIWWVHILFFILGLLLLSKESGKLFSFYYKFKSKKLSKK